MQESFPADMERIGTALADQTRRRIFLFLQTAREAVCAAEVADHFGIHRTVARIHLEKLVSSGLCVAHSRRRAGGGRPAKVYSALESPVELQLPPRQFRVLAGLLLETTQALGPQRVEEARKAGRRYGRELATSEARPAATVPSDLPSAAARAAAILNTVGAQAQVISCTSEECVIERANCVFREVAKQDPKAVCGLDQAILEGYLSEALPQANIRQLSTVLTGSPTCRTLVSLKDD